MSSAEDIWRRKTDEEVAQAAGCLADYTEEGQAVIRAEMSRRGIAEPPPVASAPEMGRGQAPALWRNRLEPVVRSVELILGTLILSSTLFARPDAEWPTRAFVPNILFGLLIGGVLVLLGAAWKYWRAGLGIACIVSGASLLLARPLFRDFGTDPYRIMATAGYSTSMLGVVLLAWQYRRRTASNL
jgi:hypothetical protein